MFHRLVLVMAQGSIFQKIIDRSIAADIVFEDDRCLAFKDVRPVAPIHVLIIPKKPIPKLSEATAEDLELLGYLLVKAREVASLLGCEDAFRLVINNGAEAGQTVFHLHIHLLAGRAFSWPPG